MTKYILILLATATFTTVGCESQRSTTPPVSGMTSETSSTTKTTTETAMEEAPEMPVATNDMGMSNEDFVAQAAQSGMAEVKLGNLAERKAVNPEVKKFATQMVTEHTRANAQLMTMAREKKWTTPAEMDEKNQNVYNKMMTVMSDEFDQTYMNQMVTDHEKAVALFEEGAATVTDQELKNYIGNTIPALKKHLESARELQRKTSAKK